MSFDHQSPSTDVRSTLVYLCASGANGFFEKAGKYKLAVLVAMALVVGTKLLPKA